MLGSLKPFELWLGTYLLSLATVISLGVRFLPPAECKEIELQSVAEKCPSLNQRFCYDCPSGEKGIGVVLNIEVLLKKIRKSWRARNYVDPHLAGTAELWARFLRLGHLGVFEKSLKHNSSDYPTNREISAEFLFSSAELSEIATFTEFVIACLSTYEWELQNRKVGPGVPQI